MQRSWSENHACDLKIEQARNTSLIAWFQKKITKQKQ